MSNYDNTNRGAFFNKTGEKNVVMEGKINIDGTENYAYIIQKTDSNGKRFQEICLNVSGLFVGDKRKDNSPDYYGTLKLPDGTEKRVGGWKNKTKDGKPYVSISLDNPPANQGNNNPPPANNAPPADPNDEVPF